MVVIRYLIILLLLFFFSQMFGQEPMQVGEEVKQVYESPHPYVGTEKTEGDLVWREEIVYSGASYIAVHFSKVELAKGDFIVVKSHDGESSWKYADLDVELKSQGRWTIPIYGEKAIIEIHSKNKEGSYGYSIDKIARGYTENELDDKYRDPDCEQQGLAAKCYQSIEPVVYDKSRAVAQLFINGTHICTGFLLGSEGHLMTNSHCIGNVVHANNTTVKLMKEGDDCNTDCFFGIDCPGTTVAASTEFIQAGSGDYSLVKLPVNVSNIYGYLQLRERNPVLNERIYIPHHAGNGKKIALESDNDPSGFATVNYYNIQNQITYSVNPGDGSSGSPVINYDDNLVVGVHFFGECQNGRANTSNAIIADFGTILPLDAISVCSDGSGGPIPSEPCCEAFTDTGNPVCFKNTCDIVDGLGLPPFVKREMVSGSMICLNPGFIADAYWGNLLLAHISDCVYDNAKLRVSIVSESLTVTNYPNPFEKYTEIVYTTVTDAPVTIFVSDISGRKVSTLIENEFKTVGTNHINFNAGNLPAGIYYCSIQAGDHIEAQKMVITK